jgi:hypothetical protein
VKRVGKICFSFKFSLLIYKGIFIMKKARILLTAVTVLGLVGGALAFKAAKISKVLYYKTDPAPTVPCSITTVLPYTFLSAPNVSTIAGYYALTVATCPFTTLYLDN